MTGFLQMLALGWMLAGAPITGGLTTPDPGALKPGEYLWHPEIAPEGPLVVIVSLDEQRAYVYRNGIAIGLSTISSGRKGHETPTGVFTILQKDRDHHSNKYDNAPMPFMERLTWDGIALHGGRLPGYPASHGCVRLPQAFAERLFSVTQRGETVVVANAKAAPVDIVHPAVLAPVTTRGEPYGTASDGAPASWWWDESASPEGPVSILVSVRDHRVYVLRNGVRIGTAPLEVADGFGFSGSVVFVMMEGMDEVPSPLDPDQKRHRWGMYTVRGGSAATYTMDALAANLKVPDAFARKVYPVLQPGTSILVTDLSAVRSVDTAADGAEPVLESDAAGDGKLGAAR